MDLRDLARDCLECSEDELSSYVRASQPGAGEPKGYALVVRYRWRGAFASWRGFYPTREQAERVARSLRDPILRLSLATGADP